MSTAIYDNIWDIWDEEVVESDIEDGINNFLKSITNALSKTNMRIAELRKLIKRKLKEAKTSPCGTLTEMIEHMNIKREPVVVSACDIQKLLLGEKDLFNMLKFTVQTFCSFILYRISIYSINTKNHAEIILTYCETLKEFLIISQSKNLPFASIVECILMFLEKLLELLHNKDFCKVSLRKVKNSYVKNVSHNTLLFRVQFLI